MPKPLCLHLGLILALLMGLAPKLYAAPASTTTRQEEIASKGASVIDHAAHALVHA